HGAPIAETSAHRDQHVLVRTLSAQGAAENPRHKRGREQHPPRSGGRERFSRSRVFVLTLALVACSTRAPRRTEARPANEAPDRVVRVVLTAANPRIGATGEVHWFGGDGRTV